MTKPGKMMDCSSPNKKNLPRCGGPSLFSSSSDILCSYAAAYQPMMPTLRHENHGHGINRGKVSHQPTRKQEGVMGGFRSPNQAIWFLTLQGLPQKLFRLERHNSANHDHLDFMWLG